MNRTELLKELNAEFYLGYLETLTDEQLNQMYKTLQVYDKEFFKIN